MLGSFRDRNTSSVGYVSSSKQMTQRVNPSRARGIHLRPVTESDLPILFEHQREPEANEMAAFPARDRDAYMAHWTKILGDETVVAMTVVVDRCVAGNVGVGRRMVNAVLVTGSGKNIGARASQRKCCPCSYALLPIDHCTPTSQNTMSHRFVSWRNVDSRFAQKQPVLLVNLLTELKNWSTLLIGLELMPGRLGPAFMASSSSPDRISRPPARC